MRVSHLLYDHDYFEPNALRFVSRVAEVVYDRDARFRVTILTQRSSPDYIEPVYRWEASKPTGAVSQGHLRFAQGVPVAGKAWSEPNRGHLLELPEFSSPQEIIKFYQDLGVDELENRLENSQMRRFRSILCIGLHEEDAPDPMVLSVDCTDPEGLTETRSDGIYVYRTERLVEEMKKAAPLFRDLSRQQQEWRRRYGSAAIAGKNN